MTDVHTPEQRRHNMQAVRGSDTRIELALRGALRAHGLIGYRKNTSVAAGRPDVAYTRWKVAVFVDGCFWHGCPQCYRPPKSNQDFWASKVTYNAERDQIVNSTLEEDGWCVLRFWEHEVRDDLTGCVSRVARALEEQGRLPGE